MRAVPARAFWRKTHSGIEILIPNPGSQPLVVVNRVKVHALNESFTLKMVNGWCAAVSRNALISLGISPSRRDG
jgi:hypothetical protein